MYDPYDWKIHDDPYPVYRALRDEAPAYFNQERNFWALSRHQDVLEGFRDPVTYSNARGVSIDEVGAAVVPQGTIRAWKMYSSARHVSCVHDTFPA